MAFYYGGRRHRGVRAGPVAGVVIACVAVIAFAFFVFCCLAIRRRNRRRRMNMAGPPAGAHYQAPYQGAPPPPPPPPRHGGLTGMLTSLLPGRGEKGYYDGPPGMAESGHGPRYGGQQYGVQGQPDGHPYGQPDGYVGDGGVALPPPSQPPPAYSSRP
ncbi:hypothetical protein VUR80DRAFT_5103 [Thermomyces stellatus]